MRTGGRAGGRWRRAVALALAVGALAGPTVPSSASAIDAPTEAGDRLANGTTLETFELPSPLVDPSTVGGHLEANRRVPKVHVLLPAGYHEDPEARWPVLWLLHGANGGTDTWIPDVAHDLYGLPAVVVMPDGGTFGMYMNWWNGGARGGPAWATYHLEVLRREIEQRYRIRPERRWHAIGGISMGGQGALRYAALLPGYFGSVVAMSAAMPDVQAIDLQVGVTLVGAANGGPSADHGQIWGAPEGFYAEGNSPFALAENLSHTRIYLTTGTGLNCPGDPARDLFGFLLDTVTELFIHLQQRKFAPQARRYGADVTEQVTCGRHTFGVWDRAFAELRSWDLFAEVPEQPTRWVYETVQTTGEMWGLRYAFTAPPREVIRFERRGALLFADGSGTVSLTGPPGCSLTLRLPMIALLSPTCPGMPAGPG